MRHEDRVKLWDAINAYAITCGGDPSRFVSGNTRRQKAVAEIETLVRRACATGLDADQHRGRMMADLHLMKGVFHVG